MPKNAQKTTRHSHKVIASPVGPLTLVANEKSLVAVLWENDNYDGKSAGSQASRKHPVLSKAAKQLKEYFAGKRKNFDLPIEFYGTDFQKRVWSALAKIPFGKTRSYGDLAKTISAPKASRAVGAATGKNPLSIVIPCHRLVGKNGTLTGFAGGLETKAQLLLIEQESL